MKCILAGILLLGLILSASVPGYAYNNIVAERPTDYVSDNESTLQIGLAPGTEIGLLYDSVIGSGAISGVGTYYVLKASGVSSPTMITRTVPNVVGYYIWGEDGAPSGICYYLIDGCYRAPIIKGTKNIRLTIPPKILSPFKLSFGVAVIVVLVTISGTYLCWSST
jgi:hypothetical protein